MKARKLRLEQKMSIPQAKLIPHPPEKVRPVLADHSVSSSRDPSALKSDLISPNRNSPSNPRSGNVHGLAGLATRPEDILSYLKSPSVSAGKKSSLNRVQPRQRTTRALTVIPDKVSDLSSLSNLAQEMKQLFACMPQLITVQHNHRKLSKSVQYASQDAGKSHPNAPSNVSSRSFYEDAVAIYQQKPYDPPLSLSTRRRSHVQRHLPRSSRPRVGQTEGGSTVRSKSSEVENLPNLPEKPSSKPVKIEELQKFFVDFHKKSRDLLGQLERNVLGKQ